jgi:hypothetical protein
MRLDIFDDYNYFNKLSEFIDIEKVDSIYPFKEMFIDPDNLITDLGDATSIYNFLIQVHFFYYYSQKHIGYILLDNKHYIVFVDDEINIRLVSDDEINWTKSLLDDEAYLQFRDFCLEKYNITYKEPNYQNLIDVKIKHIPF